MFQTLVVALDLAEDGDRALPVARALATHGPVAVDLVTVSEPGMPTGADAYELERRAVGHGWDPDAWTVVHDIDAAAGLLEHAARRTAPLLVMATSARPPMSSAVFGGVTRGVLRRSQGPVLLIGPDVADPWRADRSPADPSSSGLSPALVVGVDRAAINLSTVPAIVAWRATFGGPPPRLVEVIRPGDDDLPARQRLDDLAAELAAHHIPAATRVVVADDPVRGLQDAAADLDDAVYVAVSARYTDGRLHWHSTTQQLVARAAHPVLVVPARAVPALDLPVGGAAEDHRPFHDGTIAPVDVERVEVRTRPGARPDHRDTPVAITP
jgi:nucleotide-binding universal stress UspA family protein